LCLHINAGKIAAGIRGRFINFQGVRMSAFPSLHLPSSRRKPLAACVATLFGLAAQPAMAIVPTTLFVNTCDEGVSNTDSTHGSLRWAVANVAGGGTVDMTAIGCSTISLKTGAITVAQNDLKILGPGKTNLTVSNKKYYTGRIFNHTGTGTLALYDFAVSKGYYKSAAGNAFGGCINSAGSLYLKNIYATFCTAKTDSGTARGGAIAAAGLVQLKYSTVSASSANSGATGVATSGGVYAASNLYTTAATIKYNSATGANGTLRGYEGGATVRGDAIILASTISHNSATKRTGGIGFFTGSPGSNTVFLLESTVSGNSAGVYAGGIYSNAAKNYFTSSTVAFNTAPNGGNGSGKYYSPGFATSATFGSVYINLKNSLFSNNTYGSLENDLTIYNGGGHTTTFNSGPAYNLVRATFVSTLPADTINVACPLLGPLRDNGGLTQTHALLSRSLAIDNGATFGLTYDQRGPPYARVSGPPGGPSPQADIGAYEVQQDDIVFNTSNEGCVPLF
jgi:hypothetical protein